MNLILPIINLINLLLTGMTLHIKFIKILLLNSNNLFFFFFSKV